MESKSIIELLDYFDQQTSVLTTPIFKAEHLIHLLEIESSKYKELVSFHQLQYELEAAVFILKCYLRDSDWNFTDKLILLNSIPGKNQFSAIKDHLQSIFAQFENEESGFISL